MSRRSTIALLLAAVLGTACGPRFDDDAGGLGSATTVPGPGATVPTPSTIAGPGPAPGVTDTEIKIGYLLPLTGAAPIPSRFDKGVNAYWDYVNERGGIDGRQVKVVIEDTESQAEVGKDKAKKLIESDKVFAVVVLDRLENQEAIGRYLNDRQIPNLAIQAPANLPADQIWSFGVTIDHAVQGRLAAQYFVHELDATKVAIVYENTPTLDPGREAFEAEADALGADVVYSKAIDGQGNDFSSEALALSQSGAEVVWLYMAPTPAAKLANQADAAGFHPVWFANSISWAFNLVFAVGPESLVGARAFSPWLPLADARAETFLEAFRGPGGAEAADDDLGIVGWGIGQILAEAIANAGPELGQNSLRDALQHLQFEPDIWAPIAFDDGVRQGANQVAVLKEEDGHWVLEHDFAGEFPE